MPGGLGSSMSIPNRFIFPSLQWTFTAYPVLPSTVLLLAGAGWAQPWGSVWSYMVPIITQPANSSQGLREEQSLAL